MGPLRFLAGAGRGRLPGTVDRLRPRNPILLVNQTHDPNTGYANALVAVRLLGNAVLLTHEGYGHLSFQDPSICVDEAYSEYLIHLVTPPPGSVCKSDHLPFDPEFG